MTTSLIPVPKSKTDPFPEETSKETPVRMRLTRLDKTLPVQERLGDARMLAKHQVLRIDGVFYTMRGSEGATHLYREIPVLALDTVPTAGERACLQAGTARAAALLDREKGRFESARYVLDRMVTEILDLNNDAPKETP